MFKQLVASGGMSLYKRSAEDGNVQLPGWAWGVFLLNFIIFVPAILYASYTLGSIFPVLAIIENPNPPAYERVSLNEDSQSLAEDNAAAPSAGESAEPPKAISASLRATHRLLYSVGGWRANFRGILCALAYVVATGVVTGIVSVFPFVPGFIGALVASLALVQLSTAWAHIVMTPSNPAPFYRRLPPLRKTFEATCFPTLAAWLATTLASVVPLAVAYVLNLPVWDISDPNDLPGYSGSDSWKGLVVGIVALALWAVAVVPSHVLLIRVQASLLPPDEDTIVPVDRTFGNTVEPAIVGGKGFVTMKNALKTVSRASWIRIYLMHAKIFAAHFAISVVILAVIIPQVILIPKTQA